MEKTNKKVYVGHSRTFEIVTSEQLFPPNSTGETDQQALFRLIKDLRGHFSGASLKILAKWCLQSIKEAQEETPAKVRWYEDALEEILIESYIPAHTRKDIQRALTSGRAYYLKDKIQRRKKE